MHGVKGWVKVYSYTDPPHNILDYSCWHIRRNGQWTATRLLEGKQHGKGIIAHLEGCDDRDAAASLIDADIAVARQDLPSLDKDEYYWADLVGLKVKTLDGLTLGTVSRLMPTGSNDVLVVTSEDGEEKLIPFIRPDVVRNINLDSKVIEVDWDPEF